MNSANTISLLSYEEMVEYIHTFVDLGRYYDVHSTDQEIDELWKYWVIIVRYAYYKDDPEIFKLMVQYDKEQHQKRNQAIVDYYNASGVTKPPAKRSTPLHCVIKFARKYYKGYQYYYAFYDIVKLLLDAGASIHSTDNNYVNPLELLIFEVKHMMCDDSIITKNGCFVILETVSIMLVACSNTPWSNSCGYEYIIDNLLYHSFHYLNEDFKKLQDVSFARATAAKFVLIAKIVCQVFFELASKLPRKFKNKIKWQEDILSAFLKVYRIRRKFAQCSDSLFSITDSLTNMYRFVLLHGVDGNLYSSSSSNKFISLFVELTISSHLKYERPEMLRHLLNGLRASQVNELKTRLLANQKAITEGKPINICQKLTRSFNFSPSTIHVLLNNALERLNLEETPRSLQRLARQTIIQAMAHRCHAGAATLGLPVHLIYYVLLETDYVKLY